MDKSNNVSENSAAHNSRVTYEHDYDKHIMDIKLKIIYPDLIDADVLDVGCGETEGVYRRVGRVIRKYVGIDKDIPSDKAICEDNKEYYSCYMSEFSNGNKGTKFDVILLFGTIEEVPDVQQHLSDAKALLKSGGKIYISIPNPYALNRIMGACNGFIDEPTDIDIQDMKQGHLRLLTLDEMIKEIEKTGLKAEKSWPIGFKPLPMSEMDGLKKYWHQFDNMMAKGSKYGVTKFCAGWLIKCIL